MSPETKYKFEDRSRGDQEAIVLGRIAAGCDRFVLIHKAIDGQRGGSMRAIDNTLQRLRRANSAMLSGKPRRWRLP
jgi:hypothetical protein